MSWLWEMDLAKILNEVLLIIVLIPFSLKIARLRDEIARLHDNIATFQIKNKDDRVSLQVEVTKTYGSNDIAFPDVEHYEVRSFVVLKSWFNYKQSEKVDIYELRLIDKIVTHVKDKIEVESHRTGLYVDIVYESIKHGSVDLTPEEEVILKRESFVCVGTAQNYCM